ncbi:MAG: PP2C family protein-serine/threonine phosphatase [Planctomycetota bacterium]|jgi:sigma-B regulation protein RsbU (phosphoserine phosphatase)
MALAAESISPRMMRMTKLLREISSARTPQEGAFIYGQTERQFFPIDGLISASIRNLETGQYKLTRVYVDDNIPDRPVEDPWKQWDSFAIHTNGFIRECIDAGLPQIINNLDVHDDPVLKDSLAGFGSCLVLPVWDEGRPLNWAFIFKRDADGFTEHDLERRLLTINLHGRATKNLVALTQVKELNQRLNTQLERVAMIQRALLPDRTPDIPNTEISTSFLPSDESGGDFFDFLELPDGKWGIFLADVSGHGAGAATVAAMLYSILHTYGGDKADTNAVISYCNKHLCRKRIEDCFATAVYAVLDTEAKTLQVTNAGHLPPRRKNTSTGEVVPIEGESGIPLGIIEDFDYDSFSVQLAAGETLVFFTDGITEARNREGEFFSNSRLDESLTCCDGSPPCTVDTIHSSLYEFTSSRSREDDQTILAIKLLSDDES